MSDLLKQVAVCVRAWKNPDGARLVRRALLPMGVGHVEVMINAVEDLGAMPGFFGKTANDHRVTLNQVWVGWTWTAALDMAYDVIYAMRDGRVDEGKENPLRYFLSVSPEVFLTEADVLRMIEALQDENVAVAGPGYICVSNGEEFEGGPSRRFIRNTCAMYDMAKLGGMFGWHHFQNWCGGQEDKAAVIALNLQTPFTHAYFADHPVRVKVNKFHPEQQKSDREMTAEWRMAEYWRRFYQEGTKKRQRLEELLVEMQVEFPEDSENWTLTGG